MVEFVLTIKYKMDNIYTDIVDWLIS